MRKQYGTNPKGFTRKVLTVSPELFTKVSILERPNRKGVVALHEPGGVADCLQSLGILQGQKLQGIRSKEINNAFGTVVQMRFSADLWATFFGEPLNVFTFRGPYGDREKWTIRCTDGTVRIVGSILPTLNPPIINPQAVHWDNYTKEYCIGR